MKTYLLSHTNRDGTRIAQSQYRAQTKDNAIRRFWREHPNHERIITAIGAKGQQDFDGR